MKYSVYDRIKIDFLPAYDNTPKKQVMVPVFYPQDYLRMTQGLGTSLPPPNILRQKMLRVDMQDSGIKNQLYVGDNRLEWVHALGIVFVIGLLWR